MRRGAEAQLTTHELMAKSGHKSLSEVDCYAKAANKTRLADSGAVREDCGSDCESAESASPSRPATDHDKNELHKRLVLPTQTSA
jgi:hypothetical protein